VKGAVLTTEKYLIDRDVLKLKQKTYTSKLFAHWCIPIFFFRLFFWCWLLVGVGGCGDSETYRRGVHLKTVKGDRQINFKFFACCVYSGYLVTLLVIGNWRGELSLCYLLLIETEMRKRKK
jgi:hypothetical protein